MSGASCRVSSSGGCWRRSRSGGARCSSCSPLRGLRVSEAIGLRVMDAGLDPDARCVHVRRAIVNGQLTAPKSRHGRRTIPIGLELADRLQEVVAGRGETELLFRGAQRRSAARRQPALPRARTGRKARRRSLGALSHVAPHLRGDAHRCRRQPASSPALDGPSSAAFTLDTYGHLLGDDLGPHLDVCFEMP